MLSKMLLIYWIIKPIRGLKMIEIWHPRYRDRTVLIAKYKVSDGINKIKFTKALSLAGKVFSIKGADIKKHPTESNGRIPCYVVPLGELL